MMFRPFAIAGACLYTFVPATFAQPGVGVIPSEPCTAATGCPTDCIESCCSPAVIAPGVKAPPIITTRWIAGEPVTGFEKGRVYVVEFWATWCSTCLQSIPHLAQVQRDYAVDGVKVVGIAAHEQDDARRLERFMESRREGIPYSVAYADDDRMKAAWLEAESDESIPRVFIVNRDGVIAWIGSPASMDEPLRAIVSGDYNLDRAEADYWRRKYLELRTEPIAEQLVAARRAGDLAKVERLGDQLLAMAPERFEYVKLQKFSVLLEAGRFDDAYVYARALSDADFSDDAERLNQIAWTIVDGRWKVKDLDAAADIAERACELTDWRAGHILDTLALIRYKQGDLAGALELQEQAVQYTDEMFREEIEGRLRKFRAEWKKRGG